MEVWIHESILKSAVVESGCCSPNSSTISRTDSQSSNKSFDSSSSSSSASLRRNSTWEWVQAVIVSGSMASMGSLFASSSTTGRVKGSQTLTVGTDSSAILTIHIIDAGSCHDGKTFHISPSQIQKATERAGQQGRLQFRGILPANSETAITSTDVIESKSNVRRNAAIPNDLTQLTHLHEPSVVHCLERRYQLSSGWEMYTSSGPILIAINPCRTIKGLYGEEAMRMYWTWGERLSGHSYGSGIASNPPPPHVFSVADSSYRGMMRGLEFSRESNESNNSNKSNTIDKSITETMEEKKAGSTTEAYFANQSILVSGESGAGKTVTTKFIMQYLAALSKKVDSTTSNISKPEQSCIEQRILKSNYILESFGNARTLRNDNSSRFGKFIELRFSEGGRLMGASIDTYLLEKARIVGHTCGERSYHIFYMVFAAASVGNGGRASESKKGMLSPTLRKAMGMDGKVLTDFVITTADGVRDKSKLCHQGEFDDHLKMFEELKSAMDTMGFVETEQFEIFLTICGLLHLSNLTLQDGFVESNDGEECTLNPENKSLVAAMRMLGVSHVSLNAAVTTVQFKAVDELVKKSLNVTQAVRAVQALIKGAYDSIFSLLVERINSCIRGTSTEISSAFIGILDIFGFESFDKNSFEQLCINYCNESLQQQFNRFIFKLEQQEYQREGINWDFIDFADNQDILDLIEKKHGGILAILDEQCMLGMRCNDKTFVSAIYEKCANTSTRFDANTKQKSQGKFSIHHYAGIVEYDTNGFMKKNKDEIPMEASDLFSTSTIEFVRNFASVMASKSSGSLKQEIKRRAFKSSITRVSVGGQFSLQLQKLRRRIDDTHPHYVRCLKPNDQLRPDKFERAVVVDQLRCGGILEAIRVSRAGFPQRYSYEQFASRFGLLTSFLSDSKSKPTVRRFQSGRHKQQTPMKPLKKCLDPKKDCEALVMLIARWILSERGPKKVKKTEPEVSTETTSPSSFWKGQSPAKKTNPVGACDAGIQLGITKVFLLQDTFDCIERLRGLVLASSATKITALIRRYLTRVTYLTILMSRRQSVKCRNGFQGSNERKSNDSQSSRSVDHQINCFESVADGVYTSAPQGEPQEFEWISVGHGRFVKRSASDSFAVGSQTTSNVHQSVRIVKRSVSEVVEFDRRHETNTERNVGLLSKSRYSTKIQQSNSARFSNTITPDWADF